MRISKQAVASIVGVAVSAAFLAFALRDVSGAQLAANLSGARWFVAAPFLVALFAFYWIKTVRWSSVLKPVVHTRPAQLFAPVMVGYAAGAILPMQLGEIVRAWLGARQLGMRMMAVLMSIALERVFDLVSILFIAAITIMTIADASAWLTSTVVVLGIVATSALVVLLLLVFRTEQCMRLADFLLGKLPEKLASKMLDQIRTSAQGLAALRNVRLIALVFATSLLQWVFMFACIWLSLYAMHIEVSPVAAMLAMVFTVIGTSLPNSPGYVGSIQLAFTLALEPFGIDNSAAIAASLFFHVLAYLSVVIAGLALLPRLGLRPREFAGQARAISQNAAVADSERG